MCIRSFYPLVLVFVPTRPAWATRLALHYHTGRKVIDVLTALVAGHSPAGNGIGGMAGVETPAQPEHPIAAHCGSPDMVARCHLSSFNSGGLFWRSICRHITSHFGILPSSLIVRVLYSSIGYRPCFRVTQLYHVASGSASLYNGDVTGYSKSAPWE